MTANLSSDLNVGITAWNSETFLPLCLDSLRRTVPDAHVTVFDNESVDATPRIARERGATVWRRKCPQGEALDALARASTRPYTLLVHADVVLLSQDWWPVVRARLEAGAALVSPEDIGCGPYTRPFGRGMPESSFMCFRTDAFPHLRTRLWSRFARLPYFRRRVDFFGDHVTYNLPSRLAAAGLRWQAMRVHVSTLLDKPFFTADWKPVHWRVELGRLDYGLGNFYSLDGLVTHYHNWYDRRIDTTRGHAARETLESNGGGMPAAYLHAYSARFIADYAAGRVRVPVI